MSAPSHSENLSSPCYAPNKTMNSLDDASTSPESAAKRSHVPVSERDGGREDQPENMRDATAIVYFDADGSVINIAPSPQADKAIKTPTSVPDIDDEIGHDVEQPSEMHGISNNTRPDGNGFELVENQSTLALYSRVLTRSERNFTRLRIWLACRTYKSFGQPGVCRFGPRSVLKFTAVTRVAEAANIEYIARNTTIPVPRIQDVFTIRQNTYIVMDYIKGSELTHCGKTLSEEQQKGILEQVKEYIAQMRALKPLNPGRVEAADGSGLFDIRLGGYPYPPFASVREFHARLGHDFVLNFEEYREAWSKFEPVAKRPYRTTFTHGDIAPRNIIIKDGKIAAIIDWESAGWYPEYWEYTRWEVSNYISSQIWHDLRDEVLDPYPDELWVEDYLGTVFTRL